jgi:hypothetical protein
MTFTYKKQLKCWGCRHGPHSKLLRTTTIFNDKSVNSKVFEEESIPTLWPKGLLSTHLGYGPWLAPSLVFMRIWRNMTYLVSNSLLFLCVFWGISPSRRTLGCYASGAPPIVHVPTFPWKKKLGNQKRAIYTRGDSCCTHAFSWGLGTASVALPLGERTHMGTSPTNLLFVEVDFYLLSRY